MKRQRLLIRIVFYIIGMLILALGLTLNAKTLLGVSPVTSLPYTVSLILGVNFGNTVFISYLVFVGIELVLIKRSDRAFVLLQIPISLLFTRLMNVFDILITLRVSNTILNYSLLLIAITFTGVGAATTLSTKLIPNPVDGVVLAFAEYFHKKLGLVKNIFDFTNALIAFSLGCIVGNPFLGVGIGTVFCVFGVGRIIAVFNRYMKPWIQKKTGLAGDIQVVLPDIPVSLDLSREEAAEAGD